MNIRNNKGITLIAEVMTVLLLILIVSVITYSSTSGLQVQRLNNMYADIASIQEKAQNYYLKYGKAPVNKNQKVPDSVIETMTQELNINDKADDYYKINLEEVKNITLNNKQTNDNYYFMNAQTLTVYYSKGVKVKNLNGETSEKTYHTLPSNYKNVSKIDAYAYQQKAYLADKVEIGDYIDINFNGENGTYADGWRVLSVDGSGKKGVVTLISAGCPLEYRHIYQNNTGTSDLSLEMLNDLSSITITQGEENGFKTDAITGTTTGIVNLDTQFGRNKYFDKNKGIHAFGCNTFQNGTEYGNNTELEDLYEYITGDKKNMSQLKEITDAVDENNLEEAANANGKTWNSKWNGLLSINTKYWLGGAPYNSVDLWAVLNNPKKVTFGHNYNNGVRIVISLIPGAEVAGNNTGDGTLGSPIKVKE